MEEKIKIVQNNISIDLEKLRKIVIDEWQSGKLYNFYYDQGLRGEELYKCILLDLDNYIENFSYSMEEKVRNDLGILGIGLDWQDTYPKSDVRSIGFRVLNLLAFAWSYAPEELTADDIPVILEFLDTPPGKSLEAWEKWEKYWQNLDYESRRKKLLENLEK